MLWATGHAHVAEALGVPLHIFFTMPWTWVCVFPFLMFIYLVWLFTLVHPYPIDLYRFLFIDVFLTNKINQHSGVENNHRNVSGKKLNSIISEACECNVSKLWIKCIFIFRLQKSKLGFHRQANVWISSSTGTRTSKCWLLGMCILVRSTCKIGYEPTIAINFSELSLFPESSFHISLWTYWYGGALGDISMTSGKESWSSLPLHISAHIMDQYLISQQAICGVLMLLQNLVVRFFFCLFEIISHPYILIQ